MSEAIVARARLGRRWKTLGAVGRGLWGLATKRQLRKRYRDVARAMLAARLKDTGKLVDRAVGAGWNGLPATARSWKVTQALGRRIHQRACRVQPRGGGCYTRFFRNRPQLELLRDLVLDGFGGATVKIVSLGCSTGAELYSAVWLIRAARPEQPIQALGVDSSEACVQAAARGVYPLRVIEVAGITETSYEGLFTREGKTLVVQDWIKEGVAWAVGNACSSDLVTRFGPHDVVLANNFLFHMAPERALACLKNLARLVAPNGYLFVSGVDLDLRNAAVHEVGLVPVTARCEEIYAAEDVHTAWPLRFWGLEPLDRRRPNWPARYTTVFRASEERDARGSRSRQGLGVCS